MQSDNHIYGTCWWAYETTSASLPFLLCKRLQSGRDTSASFNILLHGILSVSFYLYFSYEADSFDQLCVYSLYLNFIYFFDTQIFFPAPINLQRIQYDSNIDVFSAL